MHEATPYLNILLIEDDPDDRLIIQQTLSENEEGRFHLFHAETLAAGIDLLRKGGIDLILLDLSLPDSHGFTTVQKLGAWARELPVIVLTGLRDRDLAKQAIQQGVEDYLVKGHIDEYSLDTAIRNAMERHRISGALHLASLQLQQVIENDLDGMIIVDRGGMVSFANPAAEAIFRKDSRSLVGSEFGFTINKNGSTEIETTDRRGKAVVLEMRAADVPWDGQGATLVCLRDITERHEIEKKLRTYSFIDELTQLYNRRAFYTVANDQLKLAQRENVEVTLFFADFDRLKFINDNYGHKAGDQALMLTSAVLKKTFRGSDIIARMGGDEFAILAIDVCSKNTPDLLARLRAHFQEINRSGAYPFTFSLSIGAAHFDPQSPLSLDALLAEADTQQYQEKMKTRKA